MKEISSSMYKVRTLPVRFGTNKLGGDRSSQPCNIKPQRFFASSPHRPQPRVFEKQILCVCGGDTEYRLGFPARQNGFVLLLGGGVVVPPQSGHSEKIFEKIGGLYADSS